jgi:condensation enzyme
MMTEPTHATEAVSGRFPLSATQEFFCSLDQGDRGGAFGLRFIMVAGWRIAGRVDTAALQGALDDVVARHELLRTVVVRDAEPPYQQVQPPCRAPLQVRDFRRANGRSRDVLAEELIIETEQGRMDPREVPLLRATLGKFDDSDSVLVLVVHHSACDGWSMQLIMRDLAAFYAARTNRLPLNLPDVRQYREYAAWQQTSLTDGADDGAREYWRQKLRGARVFTLPTDRQVPDLYTRPYSVHNYRIDAETIDAASRIASDSRGTLFMVLLAAFNILAYQINGTADSAIRAFTTGRNDPEFQDTMGLFMNVVPFRTDVSGCANFREIVARTRDTCIEAYTNEIPIHYIEQEAPELNLPHEEPMMAQFIAGMFQPQFDNSALQIADGSYEIVERVLPEPEHPDIPNGLVWNLDVLPSGELTGGVLFNLDEFDEDTVANWVSDYRRILSGAVSEPDREWKTL